jgi:hypothetical protein
MSRKKLPLLLLISFVATGAVIYQLQNRRPMGPSVLMPPESAPLPASEPPPAANTPLANTPAVIAGLNPSESQPTLAIPDGVWGRNPFLTIDEINRANTPEVPIIAEPVEIPPPVESVGLPGYSLTAVISNEQGYWAIVDEQVVRTGDQLGVETVKEIKDRLVVLEHAGRTRELPLRRMEEVPARPPTEGVRP